jgi:chromosomal replication initiator protein
LELQARRFDTQQAALKRPKLTVAPDVLPYLAERLVTNAHELTGAFLRVSAEADIKGVPMTIEFVHQILKEQLQGTNRPCSIEQIQHAVANYTGVSVLDQRSKRRIQNIVLARHMAFWLCRELTDKSYPQIAQRFGNRDHTTVIAGVRRINKLLETDDKLRGDLDGLKGILKNRASERA